MNAPPLLFEAALFAPIDAERSRAEIRDGCVIFTLLKKEAAPWASLRAEDGEGRAGPGGLRCGWGSRLNPALQPVRPLSLSCPGPFQPAWLFQGTKQRCRKFVRKPFAKLKRRPERKQRRSLQRNGNGADLLWMPPSR